MKYYEQRKPWETFPETLVTEALIASQTPGAILAQLAPPLSQIIPFPPRFGYPPVQMRQPTIDEVLDIGRNYRNRRDDISGGPQGWQAASRNTGAGTW